MNTSSTETRKPWEELDADLEANVRAATKEERAALDEAVGLQMISIRLQPRLVKTLKLIAEYHGVGYQPLIRDLLNRFAKSEVQSILTDMKAKQEAMRQAVCEEAKEAPPPMQPVSDFLERERKRA